MDQSNSDIRRRLESFRATHNRFDSLLLDYGPLMVLVQFNLTGLALVLAELYGRLSTNPQQVTWAVFSYVYGGVLLTLLAEALVIRNFLKKIPETFLRLWEGNVIEKARSDQKVTEDFLEFLNKFEKRLNSRHRFYLGLPLAILGLVFFWSTGHLPFALGKWFDASDWVTKLVVTIVNTVSLFSPAAVVGYAIGIEMWKSIITAIHVRRFTQDFDLDIQLSHPDKAGGLTPLGNLIFALAATLIVASLALSGLVFLADYVAFIYTELYSRIFLGVVIILSLIVFIWPLLSAHERMVAEKRNLNTLLVEITQRIAELERSTQRNLKEMDYKKRQEIFSEVDSLTALYKRVARTPTWPFDRDILLKFVTPQVFSLLSLVGIAEPIITAIRSLALALTGNQP